MTSGLPFVHTYAYIQNCVLFGRKRYTDPENQAVVEVLMAETKAQDPTASVSCIKVEYLKLWV